MNFDFTYLSLGAGVQSTAMLIMSALGTHSCPRADVAIFADTGDEPAWVYDHLETLKQWSPIPIHVCSKGHLSQDVKDRLTGMKKRFAAIPAWTTGKDGREAPLRRQCTREYLCGAPHKYSSVAKWVMWRSIGCRGTILPLGRLNTT
jgi:hypothetical protein